MFKYDSEEKILELVSSFETATISREAWGHPEHLVVALHYTVSFNPEEAYARMRSGIFNLLENGFKVDLRLEMPYHETLTRFWMEAIRAFCETCGEDSVPGTAERVVNELGKNYPNLFYDRERLFSEKARSEYIAPDRAFPWKNSEG